MPTLANLQDLIWVDEHRQIIQETALKKVIREYKWDHSLLLRLVGENIYEEKQIGCYFIDWITVADDYKHMKRDETDALARYWGQSW